MTDITFSFAKGIEEKLKKYISSRPKSEVFVAVFGNIRGRKGNVDANIRQLVAFPNLSDNPMYVGKPPENWMNVCGEVCKLEELMFLGFIHSHPGTTSKRSCADGLFALQLSEKNGGVLMGIVGNRSTMRMYHVDNDMTPGEKIRLIRGETRVFKLVTR